MVLGRPAVIKHLSYADQVNLDDKREEFLAVAKSMGIKTDDERIVELRKSGEWPEAKELELTRARQNIDSLIEGKRKNAHMPSLVKGYIQKIDEAKQDYENKLHEKRVLIGLTCELYAERELNDFYIVKNLYFDESMTKQLFGDEEFDYMTEIQVGQIADDYRKIMEPCSEHGVKKLAMQSFFQRYFQLCGEDYSAFFGKSIASLTSYQVDLIRWGSMFKSIYSKHDVSKWKKEVFEDPDLLIEYANSVEAKKQELEQQGANDPNAIVIGMKGEDAKAVGVKTQNPIAQIAAMGGNAMDFFSKMGQG